MNCKHYIKEFDCCARTSEWVDGVLCTDSCFYCNDEHPNCRYYEEKADFVEVKHGEWIAVPSSDMSTGKAYKCSECQKMRYGVRLPPYCQECGAKMDGKGGVQDEQTTRNSG